ncbi:unnamed protein product [Bursaphelenchus okinawaensis]|uniref:Uncharacterized protein n=1 Tax=Bursaphelenchus okinawaensis TaxID=465554 RepID=A0A811K9T9_9BILA|nr:unnamed protein product [Bursaphelenchus okinawaensis]CAG9098364.1 unnamed protein product [Bursaphelenchus okinawaensis]
MQSSRYPPPTSTTPANSLSQKKNKPQDLDLRATSNFNALDEKDEEDVDDLKPFLSRLRACKSSADSSLDSPMFKLRTSSSRCSGRFSVNSPLTRSFNCDSPHSLHQAFYNDLQLCF